MLEEILTKSKLQEWVEAKSKRVLEELDTFFTTFPNYKKMNIYPIFSNIISIDNNLLKLKERKFDNPEDVECCFNEFKNIIATINLKVVYVPSIQTFCMFMGWTSKVYKQMLNETPEDIQDVMKLIDDYILENQASAGQQGLLKQNLTKFRMQMAGNQGQNIVTQKEENDENRNNRKQKSMDELYDDLRKMGVNIEQIEERNPKTRKKKK